MAVDPEFRLKRFQTFPGRQGHLFQMTSDEFFSSGFLAALGRRPDLAFLDGMHLFEFLLRDFMNAERASAPGGVIALHDCCPFNAVMAERTWVRRRSREWTGDVWKVLMILQSLRPDLKIEVFDAAPTGLVVVTGLDPENTTLVAAYDKLVAELTDVTLEDFGAARFFERFAYADSATFIAAASG